MRVLEEEMANFTIMMMTRQGRGDPMIDKEQEEMQQRPKRTIPLLLFLRSPILKVAMMLLKRDLTMMMMMGMEPWDIFVGLEEEGREKR